MRKLDVMEIGKLFWTWWDDFASLPQEFMDSIQAMARGEAPSSEESVISNKMVQEILSGSYRKQDCQSFTDVKQTSTDLDNKVDAHWEWTLGLLESCDVRDDTISVAEYLYKTAFKHGWKHCIEENERD